MKYPQFMKGSYDAMDKNYSALFLETHLFFSRIMKEHALFLEAGFPCTNQNWIKKSDWFREQFENLLLEIILISDGQVHDCVLKSDELVTEFTLQAEQRTKNLSGISINTKLTTLEQNLCNRCRCVRECTSPLHRKINRINLHALQLLDKLIAFKESILCEVQKGDLFTTNYPLLIEHIIREAKLYRSTIQNLLNQTCSCYQDLFQTEVFWNRIMMEHALFIRGLLDPSEDQLIDTADEFANDYKRLLMKTKEQDCISTKELTRDSLSTTLQYKEFKTAGVNGILNRDITSIILPLLADHVLREANHYIRLLSCIDTPSYFFEISSKKRFFCSK